MSAYIVPDSHLDYLCAALVAYQVSVPWGGGTFRRCHDPRDDADLQAMRDALELENVASVNYRYKTSENAPTYRPVRRLNRPIDPIQVIKGCQCLEYQSCEHPEWPASFAKRILRHLNSAAVGRLPGYEKAEWTIGGLTGRRAA